ncbi:MAG: hypothetical protein OXH69_13060 [Acidobacteria bacterium]|nr:hypothetical protein [Acidobacteriota bacterium]
MMPVLGVVGVGGRRWAVPLPLPLVVLWPLVLVPLGAAAGLERLLRPSAAGPRRPTVAGAVLAMLWQLSGLRIDVCSARGVRVLLWLL